MLWNASIPVLPAWHILLFQLNYTCNYCVPVLSSYVCDYAGSARLQTCLLHQ